MDERYDRSADMRLLELQREALGVPARIMGTTSYSDPDVMFDMAPETDHKYVQNGAVLIAAIDAQPRTSLIPGALVTVSLSVANDGDLPARGVRMSLPLPADTAYRPGTLSIDGDAVTDAAANDLFSDGFDIGEIERGGRRTLLLRITIEAGVKDIILSPHLRAASGAVLGLRAIRLRRGAPASTAPTERPFYESDAAEHALESFAPAGPPATISILQPREFPLAARRFDSFPNLDAAPATPRTGRGEHTTNAMSPVDVDPVAEPVAAVPAAVEPVTFEHLAKVPVEAQPVAAEAAVVEPPAVAAVIEPPAVAAVNVRPLERASQSTEATPPAYEAAEFEPAASSRRTTKQLSPKVTIVAAAAPQTEPVKTPAPAPLTTHGDPMLGVATPELGPPVKQETGIKPKAKPRPKSKKNVTSDPEPARAPVARATARTVVKAVPQTVAPAGARPKIDVVRSSDARIAIAGRGGALLCVRLDRRRLATLTGLFSGASLGMIAHYLVLNALAAKDALAGEDGDGSIAAFVANQEQLLSRALIATRLGKTPSPDSLSAELPGWPIEFTAHSDERHVEIAPPGSVLLVRAFQTTDMAFLQRTMTKDTAAPFLRAAQLFVGLCANDAVIGDERSRRQTGVALTAYAALATAEISRIFLQAKLNRNPSIFKSTDAAFDDAARTVLVALTRLVA